MNYPVELKMKILSEYEQGKVGYKLLARKYSLKRDTVRYWVFTNKVHMKIEDKIQTEEKRRCLLQNTDRILENLC